MKLLPAVLLAAVQGDVYMHMPRGSNNRLNERSTGRQNGNRLFDSQNNNNGGYNVADHGVKAAESMDEQHSEAYFQSGKKGKSYMNIEWFNQHGCGKRDGSDANSIDCHMVIQYKCSSITNSRLRNGISTQTPQYTRAGRKSQEDSQSTQARKAIDMEANDILNQERGEHETWENYDACYARGRNEGLFLADQKPREFRAIYTRQNAHGNRRGYECPEERDYFPYWHPTEWTDIAVLTSAYSKDACKYYTENSSNRAAKGECVELAAGTDDRFNHASNANNEADCLKIDNALWVEFYDYKMIIEEVDSEDYCDRAAKSATYKDDRLVWGYPRQIGTQRYEAPKKACMVMNPDIDCKEAPWARANHLGNTDDTDDFASYRWELPTFDDEQECVLRMRYNISSDDYAENFDSGDVTPYFTQQTLTNDPVITTKNGIKLQLAINTAQIARTFQDRTHTFKLLPRQDYGIADDENIENIQVRGKRGNIVQTFPAVEYDFSPQRSTIDKNSLVHIQWAGSNSNPNGNAGEGTRGTDRSNMVTMGAPNHNIPIEKLEHTTIQSEPVQGKIIMVHRSEYRSVHDAIAFCESIGMELPVPTNFQENEAFASLDGGKFFLGVSGTWSHLHSDKTIEFGKWSPREGDELDAWEDGRDYVVFTPKSGEWKDAPAHWENQNLKRYQTVCTREVANIDDDFKGIQVGDEVEKVEYLTIEHEDSVSWRVHRSEYRPFDQAKNYCESLGMKLPVPLTRNQNDALRQIDGGNFYLGISDQKEEGSWVNVYDDAKLENTFFRWGQPDDYTKPNSAFKYGEDYVTYMYRSATWNDIPNDFKNDHVGSYQTVCVQDSDVAIEAFDQPLEDMFENVEWVWSAIGDDDTRQDNANLAIQMASSGYYACAQGCDESIEDKEELQNQLNNAPASFHGNLIRFNTPGVHYFMSTRNNNFSNRAQKGDITVV